MQAPNNQIHLVGPLSVDIRLKINTALQLVGDSHIAKKYEITNGGPILKIARILKSLGYPVSLSSYVGNDDYAHQIIENIKEEKIEANIQKLPNTHTPVSLKLHDNQDCSNYYSLTKDLSLWEFRLKTLPNDGLIFLHPAIPSYLQSEIIKKCKNATIVLQKPLDGNLEIFETDKTLTILLNENDAFNIFTSLHKGFFGIEKILQSKTFENHHVLIEGKNEFITLNEKKAIKKIDTSKFRLNYAMINEYFQAGVLAGLFAKKDHLDAFALGLAYGLESEKQKEVNKLTITAKSNNLHWK